MKPKLYALALLAVVMLAAGWASARQGQPKTLWEYKAITIGPKVGGQEIGRVLRELGANGWELVSVQSYNADGINGTLYFKRPLQ